MLKLKFKVMLKRYLNLAEYYYFILGPPGFYTTETLPRIINMLSILPVYARSSTVLVEIPSRII